MPAITVTPYDLLGDPKTTGGTWSYTGSITPAPSAPGTHDGTIDFTGFDVTGDYTYEYTVTGTGCSDTQEITITVYDHTTLKNDDCETSTTISTHNIGLTGSTTYTGASGSDTGVCPGTSPATLSGVALPTAWPGAVAFDVWYDVYVFLDASTTSNITVTIDSSFYGSQALTEPNLALYTTTDGACTGLVFQTGTAGDTYTAQANVTLNDINTFLYIRVGALAGDGGKFDITIESQV